ncbi:MAG: zf-HC2 domain-containing protein [Candidatus Krumholzibacteriota bacterium]
MRCQKVREYISLEMDELLPPAVTGDVTSHLDSCADCRDYREDLLLGRRALEATTPELSENFEWKLQLKLNQALQQSAGQAVYPWDEADPDKWGWFRNFGAAAAVGMAAVLALAMFLGPVGGPGGGVNGSDELSPGVTLSTNGGPGSADRRPFLGGNFSGRGLYSPGIQRSVSAAGTIRSGGTVFDRGWSGRNVNDLVLINRLRNQNKRLSGMLFQQQQEIRAMRALLDTSDIKALNLEQE